MAEAAMLWLSLSVTWSTACKPEAAMDLHTFLAVSAGQRCATATPETDVLSSSACPSALGINLVAQELGWLANV